MTQQVTPEDGQVDVVEQQAEAIQSGEWTSDDLRQLFNEVLASPEQASRMYRQIQQQVTPLQQSQAEFRSQLTDLLGNTKQTRQMVERVFNNAATPEDIIEIKDAQATETQNQLKAELATYKAKEQLAAQQQVHTEGSVNEESAELATWSTSIRPRLERFATKNGLTWEEAVAAFPTRTAAMAGVAGLYTWEPLAEAALERASDKKRNASVPNPNVPNDRPIGDSSNHTAIWAAYGRGERDFRDPAVRRAGEALGAI